MKTDDNLLHPLLHSADLVHDRLRRQLAPLGIRPRQARIIEALGRMGEASQVELTRTFDVTAASMSTMTERLLAEGWIYRRNNPNEKRSQLLGLTRTGQSLLAQIKEAWGEIDAVMIAAIGEEDASRLAEYALKLRIALGGEIPSKRAIATDPKTRSTKVTA